MLEQGKEDWKGQSQAKTQRGWGVEGWRTHLYPAMSTPPPPPPPGPRTPGKGCAPCTVCSSEIRLLRQRSGLAGYRALPAPLSPLAGAGAGQGTQGGPTEGPREKERVGRHSTGRLLQDTPVLSVPANVADGKPTVRHVPTCQDTEANTFRRRVDQASRGALGKVHWSACQTFLTQHNQQEHLLNFILLIYKIPSPKTYFKKKYTTTTNTFADVWLKCFFFLSQSKKFKISLFF